MPSKKRQMFLRTCQDLGAEPVEYGCSTRLEDARALGARVAGEPDRPGAVITFSDFIASGFMRGLRDAGLRVPDDLALIGIDNTAMGEYSYVALSTIDVNRRQYVVASIEMLLAMQNNGDFAPHEVKVPTQLIVRESG